MDMGYVVIAIFIGVFAVALWPVGWFKRKTHDDSTKTQPGRRLEGSFLINQGSNDGGGGDGGGGGGD
jgi:hypothetical protein